MSLRSLLVLAVIGTVSTSAVSAATPIEEYFLEYLQGKNTTYTSSKRLKPREVEEATAEVWNAWKTANSLYEEEKLPSLTPLKSGTVAEWHLPDSLENNATLSFFWGTKSDTVPENGYPMYIYFHGSGPRDLEWLAGYGLAQRFEDAPSAYYIPRIPNEGKYYRWWQRAKLYAWEKLLRQALASEAVNPDRIYMFGISEGAYGSQRLASYYADYLAGAGPMAGGEPLKNAPAENLRNTAFSLRTGALDQGFYREKLTRRTLQALDSLKAIDQDGYIYNIELIPEAGHAIDYSPTTPWLAQHVRNPYPKHISWENFEVDSVYRNGFYNLYVDERSNPDFNSRTRYDMHIEDNHVTIDAQVVEYTPTEIDPMWQIELDFVRSYKPADKGVVTIYLNDKLVDLTRPVTVTANGKTVFKGKVKLLYENLVNSCAEFFDPDRIYPAAIKVDFSK